jgi:hypothetical protein
MIGAVAYARLHLNLMYVLKRCPNIMFLDIIHCLVFI